jgi:hypothetical protein
MLISQRQQELLLKNETSRFLDLFAKIDGENPDLKDLWEAEKIACSNPSIWQVGLGYSGSILEQFIDKLNPSKGQQLILKTEIMSIKNNLGYNTSNESERLIIDQILLCWAGMNYAEARMHNLLTGGDYLIRTGEYWQDNLTRYQNRYLKAIEMLARVRRLNKNMILQVNIASDGGQQVNVNK